MVVFDDLVAEQDALDAILGGLDDPDWAAPSAAAGWTVADVVLHLAQTEEAVTASAAGAGLAVRSPDGATLDEVMDRLVRAERQPPAAVLQRWRAARLAAVAALRAADPDQPLPWAAAPLKPATLATTRLAEHWAHGLDITGPLGIPFPDTARLRHIAWLAYRTLPYAFALAGEQPQRVFCALTAPDGRDTWRYGPPDADSAITGPAGAFCRVAAQRLTPGQSGLLTSGPHGASALGLLRTYAVLPPRLGTQSGRGRRVNPVSLEEATGNELLHNKPCRTAFIYSVFRQQGIMGRTSECRASMKRIRQIVRSVCWAFMPLSSVRTRLCCGRSRRSVLPHNRFS
jgi:uncharacterized protein (TIGR03084 family)